MVRGASGCGKSTLASLLLGLYKPTKGAVLIDGVEVAGYDREWLASQIGVVDQDAPLWSRSVRDNIRYGKLDCSDLEVEEAAKAANAHTFITTQLPQGYDTVIGKGGQTLSGGQRQRIAIARAIVKRPPILLLDEATASLDPEGEATVVDALRGCMVGRTVVAIAHKLEAYTATTSSSSSSSSSSSPSSSTSKVATIGVPPVGEQGAGGGGGSRVLSVLSK